MGGHLEEERGGVPWAGGGAQSGGEGQTLKGVGRQVRLGKLKVFTH